jgi:hypothetical protein
MAGDRKKEEANEGHPPVTDQPRATWQSSGTGVPWRQLTMGVLVPIVLFYMLHRLGQSLAGAVLAISWSISLLAFTYWRSRRFELFPALAIPIVLKRYSGCFAEKWNRYRIVAIKCNL